MEIVVRPMSGTVHSLRQLRFYVIGLWIGGLATYTMSSGQRNTASLFAAASIMFLLVALDFLAKLFPGEMKISVEGPWLRITKGNAYLWGSALDSLVEIEVIDETLRGNRVVTPQKVIFRRDDCDSYTFANYDFDDAALVALKSELERGKGLK